MEPTKKILVVDDAKSVRDMFSKALKFKGYDVETAENGYLAIELVKQKSFNIALVDLKMPGMNGIELLKNIKQYSPETEVILITAYGSLESSIDAINSDAFSYIRKPIDLASLFAVLDKAIEKQRLVLENKKLIAELEKLKRSLEQKK